MNNIKFTNPYLLLISIPLAIFIVVFFILMKKKSVNSIVSLVIHLVICALIGVSCANVSFIQTIKNTELFVVADVSESCNENDELIDNYIHQINNQVVDGTKMGVVCFGKNYELITPLNGRIKSVSQTQVDKSATDLAGALLYTNSLFSQDVVKRMIIISDGNETDNASLDVLQTLLDNDVYIDAIYLHNQISEDEVQVNDIAYTENPFINHKEILKANIQAANECETKITLLRDGNAIEERNIILTRGINIVNFELDTSIVGSFSYELRIDNPKDKNKHNNSMQFRQTVTDEIKVLFISENTKDYNVISRLYGEKTEFTPYVGTYDIPTSLEELCKYDEIVLSNINMVQIDNYNEFVENLELFVSVYGKSLITFGATYASGTSSEYMSKYNAMLPVQFESSEGKLLTLLIDASSSMEENDRLTMAKEGAIACLDLLGEKDSVAVISFGEDINVVQPIVSATKKDKIISAINSINVSYATMMGAGLKKAYSLMKNADFDDKHLILLSDGQPFESESEIQNTVYNMAQDGINTSVINISCKDGEALMKEIALIGNGTYYYVSKSGDLVDIILTSVADEVANTAIEGDFKINRREENDEVLTDIKDLPNVKGYNYSRIKFSANTVLTVTYTNDEGGTREVPLFAYWNYGNGRVATFTSNIGSSWTNELRNSDEGNKLLKNMISNNLPAEHKDSALMLSTNQNGFTTNVSVTLGRIDPTAYLKVKVISPSGNEEERYVKLIGSNYSSLFTTNEVGEYQIHMEYTINNNTYVVDDSFYFSYSKEYRMFNEESEILLYKLTKKTGSLSDDLSYKVNYEETINRNYKSITIPLLYVILGLFVIDVFFRKFHFKKK